ncbi:hypothetical protein ABZS66_11675 [Dactylosporangium sp. NPDC005572]|uniref:hypothetical protein n=1 Tax=Dactylosporangium sp. NPDC005572 TaxID=3156889 RepID=UPI0033BEFB85
MLNEQVHEANYSAYGTDLPMQALEMAIWSRDERLDGLIRRCDAGHQYTAIRYTDALAGVRAAADGRFGRRQLRRPGRVNALGESIIGQIKSRTHPPTRALAHAIGQFEYFLQGGTCSGPDRDPAFKLAGTE